MSIAVPTHKKSRILLGAAALLGALFLAILALRQTGTLPASAPSDSDRGPIEVVDQAPEQAPWKVRVYPAGAGTPSRSQKKAVEGQRGSVEAAVTAVADALLLEPAAIEAMSGKELAPDAAAALARSKLSPPADMEDLQATARRVKIGIEANEARHAAARLAITAKGTLGDEPVRFRQQITMWLERSGGRWKIVAFDGSQRQLR